MIPLLHDLHGETVLIFGGGPVGARKARRFAREAHVVVVSPSFADADFGGAERIREAPEPGDLAAWLDRADPALVVAATDDVDLNARIEDTASERGTLVNRTDTHGERDAGSVVVPATVRDDPVVVAVSTGGASPALSRHLRERLEGELSGAGAMAELTADLREELQARGVDGTARREAIRAVVESQRVWKHLGGGDANAHQIADAIVSDTVGDRQ